MQFFNHEEINLLEAAQDGKLEFIQSQLAPLHSKHLQDACKKTDYYGRNALHYAAYKGHFEVVEYLLDLKCININSKDNQGNSALVLACVRGYNQDINTLSDGMKYRICKLLLDRGASIQEYSKNGSNNPLHWTCYYGDMQCSKVLLEKDPYLMLCKNDSGQYPIDYTMMQHKELINKEQDEKVAMYLIVKFLVDFLGSSTHKQKLEDMNQRIDSMDHEVFFETKKPPTPPVSDFKKYEKMGLRYLFWASVLGNKDLVASLLQFNFSPFEEAYKGRNAIHGAAYHGHQELLELFFESDLTLSKRSNMKKIVNLMTTEEPQTALHIAVQRGHENVVSYLVERGADQKIYNFRNQRPFDSSRLPEIKVLRQNFTKNVIKNLIRGGYKYILVGHSTKEQHNNLLLQQLMNIQEKRNKRKRKFKILCQQSMDEKLQYYIIKVNNRLMNDIAAQEGMMVYNMKQGFISKFQLDQQYDFETFHNSHVQQIVLNLLYEEFDLDQFMDDGILIEHYPLHDPEEKQLIYKFWRQEKWSILMEPFSLHRNRCRTLSVLQSYFGAEVGFFFQFLTFFTTWLLIPAVPGILLAIYTYMTEDRSSSFVPIYIIFLAMWATIFFEFWKRKQSETAFVFDMHIAEEEKRSIPQYRGQYIVEEVGNQITVVDDRNEQWKYVKSVFPLVTIGLMMIACEFILYAYVAKYFKEEYPNKVEFKYGIAAGYGFAITITNEIFNYFARRSMNFENHQYEDEKERAYILKVFIFAFLNCYAPLIYYSLWVGIPVDIEILVLSFTVTWGSMHLLRYTVYPMVYYCVIRIKFQKIFREFKKSNWQRVFAAQYVETESKLSSKRVDDKSDQLAFVEEVEANRIMLAAPNYIEQFTYFITQFCMVTMFGASSQVVPIFILISNIVNIEGLLYAYMNFVQRPIAQAKKSIGLWNDILLGVGYIGTVINCLTIYIANQEQLNNLIGEPSNSSGVAKGLRNFLLLIAAEHIVIGLKFLIEGVIPDEPDWVVKVQMRQDHLHQKYLQHQQHRSIHGSQNSIRMQKLKQE